MNEYTNEYMNIKEDFDLIIIGAGPAGLALAQCCSNLNQKILIKCLGEPDEQKK